MKLNCLEMKFGNFKEQFVGRELTIQTYDENSQLIDRVQGKSVSIEADDDFSLKDTDGNTVEKSSVLNITVGGKQMLHVGSSLIAYEAAGNPHNSSFPDRCPLCQRMLSGIVSARGDVVSLGRSLGVDFRNSYRPGRNETEYVTVIHKS